MKRQILKYLYVIRMIYYPTLKNHVRIKWANLNAQTAKQET